jgi:hypothetical protein
LLKDPYTTLKFGYLWWFKQPDKNEFAKGILKMLATTEDMIKEYCKNEDMGYEQIGYRPDTWITMIKNDNEWAEF